MHQPNNKRPILFNNYSFKKFENITKNESSFCQNRKIIHFDFCQFKFRQTKDGLVDATPEVRKSLEDTLAKLKNAYGAESEDLLSVPKLDFKGKIGANL